MWKFTKLSYGIAEAGRQWERTCEQWMSSINLRSVTGTGKVFTGRNVNGDLILVIAKTVDDLFITGTQEAITEFIRQLKGRFEVGSTQVGKKLQFKWCEMSVSETGSVKFSMEEYCKRLKLMEISLSN